MLLIRPEALIPGFVYSPPASDDLKFGYRYSTVAVEHLREMKSLYQSLQRKGKLSYTKTYQNFLNDLEYEPPKEIPAARSIIVVAMQHKLYSLKFRLNGKGHVVLIPGIYPTVADGGGYLQAVKRRVSLEILKDPDAKLVACNPPLKALAVCSRLAEYGKNNIAYVDEYGSFHSLFAFWSDRQLPDQWGPFRMLRYCKGCSLCIRLCPTQAITESNFMIDVDRCITLYNEIPGQPEPIPGWMGPKVHNALLGCLKCQLDCPANLEAIRNIEHIADITENETQLLMSGRRDARIEESIVAKIKVLGWYAARERIPFLARNLTLLLAEAART